MVNDWYSITIEQSKAELTRYKVHCNERIYRMNVQMNGMIYKWMDEWMNGRTDTWLKGGIYIYKCNDKQMKGGTNGLKKGGTNVVRKE